MALRSKLVAALAITLLALPTAALASCWLHKPGIGEHATDCQMMGERTVLASIKNVVPDAPCCELSSGKPVPASVVPVPSTIADGVTPLASVPTTVVNAPTVDTYPILPPIRPSGPALQAFLCVFLI
jgi:hypothetical protein